MIPYKSIYINNNEKRWMTLKLKVLYNEKHAAFRRKDYENFKRLKLKAKNEITKAKRK